MFRIERKRVPKPVADRKHWAKFGDATNDVDGPDPATTKIADDVFLTLTTNITVSLVALCPYSRGGPLWRFTVLK